jgi:hypothetical protein
VEAETVIVQAEARTYLAEIMKMMKWKRWIATGTPFRLGHIAFYPFSVTVQVATKYCIPACCLYLWYNDSISVVLISAVILHLPNTSQSSDARKKHWFCSGYRNKCLQHLSYLWHVIWQGFTQWYVACL